MDLVEITETIIQGLPNAGDVDSFSYTEGSGSPYIIVGRMEDDNFYGFCQMNGSMVEIPIGFSCDGAEPTPEKESFLHLPMLETDCKATIGESINGTFTAFDGAPFPVLGIDGRFGIKPLVLLYQSEGSWNMMGVYSREGEIGRYNLTGKSGDKLAAAFFSDISVPQERIPVALLKEDAEKFGHVEVDWKLPQTVNDYLDQSIIGQDEAKRIACITFANYALKHRNKELELPFSNLLLIGPDGTGKRTMFEALTKRADLPFAYLSLDEDSYAREDLTDSLYELLASKMKGHEPHGVVYLDNFEAMATSNFQKELLNLITSGVVGVKGKAPIITNNLLFVSSMNISDENECKFLERIETKLGGLDFAGGLFHSVDKNDLMEYGISSELVSAHPILIPFEPLMQSEIVDILDNSRVSPLKPYKLLFSVRDIPLEIASGVSQIIVDHSPKGTLSLNSVCEGLFNQILENVESYKDPEGKVILTPGLVKELLEKK